MGRFLRQLPDVPSPVALVRHRTSAIPSPAARHMLARWRPSPRPHATVRAVRRRGAPAACSTAATPSCAPRCARCSRGPSSRRRSRCRPTSTASACSSGRASSPPRASPRPGFRSSSAGSGDPGRQRRRRSRRSRFGDLSLLVKFGVQFGLWGGAIHQLGTRAHHERYLKAIATLELPGCFAMTEAGHGSNVQHLETTATYDPDDAGVRDRHARRRGAQGVHRQRRLPRPDGGGVRAADRRRRVARRARAGRAAARRAREPLPGRPDRGLRREDGPERRRQRADLVRPRARAARRAAEPLRRRQRPRACTRARSRTPTSASSRCWGRSSRGGCASPARRSAPPRPR